MQHKWLKQFKLLIIDEVDSTNDEAKRIALSGDSPENLVIWGKKQTAGRGRYGKEWASFEGNLYCSIILPRTDTLEKSTQLSFVAALAVSDSICQLAKDYNLPLTVKHKWPNDILVNDKKIAGILLESAGENNGYIVVGIGLNIENSPLDLPNTTSLHEQQFHFTNAGDMVNRIMSSLLNYYQIWLSEEFLPIREMWLKKAAKIGEIVTVNLPNCRISGLFKDIDFNGALRIKLASGQIHTINTGEVFFQEE